jgi:pimeloyl-ACP methyl ester carboxylesterase
VLNHHRQGTGEPLVLIHGIGSRWQGWGAVIDALARERDVVAIDLPGFGGSPLDGTPATVEGFAARVEGFFRELGLDRPHVAGSSMGGGIALELARRGSVASATAVSPVGFWTDKERRFCQQSLRGSRRFLAATRPVAPLLFRPASLRTLLAIQTCARGWRLSPEDFVESVDAALAAPGFDEALEAFSEHRFHDPDELRNVPVTIAWGNRDYLLLHRQAARAARMLPWARHVTLDGCGHLPFSDDPELSTQVLLEGSSFTEPLHRA